MKMSKFENFSKSENLEKKYQNKKKNIFFEFFEKISEMIILFFLIEKNMFI